MPEQISATEDTAQVIDDLLMDLEDLRDRLLDALDLMDGHDCDRLEDALDGGLNRIEGACTSFRRATRRLTIVLGECQDHRDRRACDV